jgi:threonine aldolase
MNRRELVKLGLTASALPLGITALSRNGAAASSVEPTIVSLASDGRPLTPMQYAMLLQSRLEETGLGSDTYGGGGAVEELESRFTAITGKEAALFLPTGTMANQLALKVLSGDRSKIFVQDQSHVFRDEVDAAQIVHGKRLMPLAPGAGNFTLEELQSAVEHYRRNEVFETGVGAISIENTVRRQNEEIFDIGEIRRIAEYARENEIGMHLDGARLHLASAWSGISIREYSNWFDTVYISMYKVFNAGAGAVLAGPKTVIDQIAHWMKAYGGTMRRNWHNALIALHFLDGIEERLAAVRQRAEDLYRQLNGNDRLRIERIERGSNKSKLFVDVADVDTFARRMREEHSVLLWPRNDEAFIPVKVNETLLDVPVASVVEAFESSLGT